MVDNQLAYIDQASFLALRALGHEPVQQLVWVYAHDMDIDRLRTLHAEIGKGLLGRRIERSPLPFGRHRWVADSQQSEMAVSPVRPRSELVAWMDEQALLGVDPENGPAWRMAVVPFDEGGGAVTLVVSHSVGDVGATMFSIIGAALKMTPDLGYPPPRSRRRMTAIREDLRETIRSMPDIAKALKSAVSMFREERPVASRSPRSRGASEGEVAIRPTVFVAVPTAEWDERASALGGNSNVLVAAFAARLGYLMDRTGPDGWVTIQFPMSERTPTDTRANALNGMSVRADPVEVVTDLTRLRADFKTQAKALGENQHKLLAQLALTPMTPKPLVRKLEGLALGEGPAVGCSNMGEVPELLMELDGTPAEFVLARGVEWPAGSKELDRVGHWLFVGSGRVGGKVFLFVTSWIPGSINSASGLQPVVEKCLSDFELIGSFV